jgi:deoxyribodipyrimidine photo-lyase
MKHERALWLIKRDFRLYDNEALFEAVSASSEVLPVYCFETLVYEGKDWGRFHSYAVKSALTALRKNLRHHSSDVYICQGDLLKELSALKKQYAFTAIHAHEETGLMHTFARDKKLMKWCRKQDVSLYEYATNGVVRALKDRDTWERHFKAFIRKSVLPIPDQLSLSTETKILARKTRVPSNVDLKIEGFAKRLPAITEATAHRTLKSFLRERGMWYRGGISSMNTAPTRCSRLSFDLAWGTISLRAVMQATQHRRDHLEDADPKAKQRFERSLRAFKSRLYWHAHFVQKLESEATLESVPQNRAFIDALPVVRGAELIRRLTAWKTGTTGYPAIDAAMRYYQKNGWLNFRSRAMIVSFAVHGLRIPWERIVYELAPFMMDYVPGIHVAQVQMQAGVTGINIIRVYSPVKQMIEKDPDAQFIRANVKELHRFHPDEIFDFENRRLGSYPEPIVDFKKESKIMKDALYLIKKSDAAQREAARVYEKHGSRMRGNRS